MLLWLWHRPAAAALIRPLAWEPPYAESAALKRQKIKNKDYRENLRFILIVIQVFKNHIGRIPFVAKQAKNPTSIHEDAGLITGPTQWVKDLALLWLWCRPAAAALIRPLAWELPYAAGVALKSKN